MATTHASYHDALAAALELGSSGTGPSTRCPDYNGHSFFTTGAWWQELGRTVTGDAVAPDSATLLAGFTGSLRVDFSTDNNHGGNSYYGIPYNIAPGTQPLLPITITGYPTQSDPGPVPFYVGMSIERWYDPSGIPPTLAQLQAAGGDLHGIVVVRDEASGGVGKLYECYQIYSADGGATWGSSAGLAVFDLTTGAPRPEFWTSADAGGLPMLPLQVNYGEAARAAAGGRPIDHPFRIAISPGYSRNQFVWPARHAVYSGSGTYGLPMGARLRLKDAWYQANKATFDPITRAVVDAMHDHGLIVADLAGGGMWLTGINDGRWTLAQLTAMAIPCSSFEVLDTIKPRVIFTGPASGAAGTPQTFTITDSIVGDSNFAANLYLSRSADGGATWGTAGLSPSTVGLWDQGPGPFTVTFTPPAPGTYLLAISYGGKEWIAPPNLTFTAT